MVLRTNSSYAAMEAVTTGYGISVFPDYIAKSSNLIAAPIDLKIVRDIWLVSHEETNKGARIRTVIVCALTSNLKRASEPGNVLLDAGEGSLPRQSVAVVSQVCSVEKARLGGFIGALSEARVEQILAGLRFQQAAFFGER